MYSWRENIGRVSDGPAQRCSAITKLNSVRTSDENHIGPFNEFQLGQSIEYFVQRVVCHWMIGFHAKKPLTWPVPTITQEECLVVYLDWSKFIEIISRKHVDIGINSAIQVNDQYPPNVYPHRTLESHASHPVVQCWEVLELRVEQPIHGVVVVEVERVVRQGALPRFEGGVRVGREAPGAHGSVDCSWDFARGRQCRRCTAIVISTSCCVCRDNSIVHW
mmetsp:Transcript_13303/g.28748  ORF Transcript_13303/g.28748 Transcript_13303/m.28748 type:complete len:220 (-) Transcript_13303:126-785(-)